MGVESRHDVGRRRVEPADAARDAPAPVIRQPWARGTTLGKLRGPGADAADSRVTNRSPRRRGISSEPAGPQSRRRGHNLDHD